MIRFLLFFFCFCSAAFAEISHTVLVSVSPYKFIAKQIAGDTVNVGVMVPAGASLHTYEPTPRQMTNAAKADAWFRIGESFEGRAAQAFESANPQMRFVDLRKGVNLIVIGQHGIRCCQHAGSEDLHIWLSPKEMKIQAKLIADTLMALYPEHRDLYQQRLTKLLNELDALDREIANALAPLQNRVMMVSHPAYAYYARDYNLVQIPIEYEGKEPTPRQLETILQKAKDSKIKVIFVQKQYGTKAAELIANQIGAKIVMLDPYGEQYFVMMREITRNVAAQENAILKR